MQKEGYFPISIDFAEEYIHLVHAIYIEITEYTNMHVE